MKQERLLRHYAALMSAVPQSVWVLSADGVITLLAGSGLRERLWHPDDGTSWMDAVHPKDRDWFRRAWRRTTEESSPLDTVVRVRLKDTPDRFRHIKIIAVPVLDEEGGTEWVGTAADAEDHWRVRIREKLLARMAAVPAAHDLSEAFLTTAAAVVPELADAVAVFHLRGERGPGHGPPRRAAYAPSTQSVGLAPGLPSLYPLDSDILRGAAPREVVENQEARLLVFPPGEPPEDSLSTASVRWLRRSGATSVALVPVVVDGRAVALVATTTCRGNPPPDEADLNLLQDVFQQMSGPLRRTMELQSIRDKALALQQSFLTPPPVVDGISITALYHPADSAAEVGGDWYDAVRLSADSLALSIGDIAGHDLNAAAAMGRVNSLLRGLAYDSGPAASPAVTLRRLDRIVQALDGPSMVTTVHTVIRRLAPRVWRVTLSNAGHPPPMLIPRDAPPRYLHGLTAPDPPLCVTDDLPRTDLHTVIREGDTLVLYTDGLVEAPGTDIGDNLRRLREHTEALVRAGVPLETLIRRLLPPAHDRLDDIAVIALQARAGQ